MFQKTDIYESYIKSSLIIVIVFVVYLSNSNIRVLNILGLVFSVLGAIFLVVGSGDSLNPLSWSKDKQPPNLKRDWRHLLEKNYGLYQESSAKMDYLTNTWVIRSKYPVLRLKAAEFGPWLLLIGFVLQIYAIWIA